MQKNNGQLLFTKGLYLYDICCQNIIFIAQFVQLLSLLPNGCIITTNNVTIRIKFDLKKNNEKESSK